MSRGHYGEVGTASLEERGLSHAALRGGEFGEAAVRFTAFDECLSALGHGDASAGDGGDQIDGAANQ